MRAFVQEPKTTEHAASVRSAGPDRARFSHNHQEFGRETAGRAPEAGLKVSQQNPRPGVAAFPADFSRIPLYARTAARIQTKLSVSTPGDSYEREADRVAAQVLRMPETQVQGPCACGGTCSDCTAGGHDVEGPQRQASHGQAYAPEPSVPPESPIHDVLRSPGQPLDLGTRAFMNPRFGHDFARVRVHIGPQAAASATALRARAYTLGNHIVFGAGQYAPTTASGRLLIAHELTHVLQQGSTPEPMRQADPAAKQEEEPESRAEGREVGGGVSGVTIRILQRGGLRVSRDLAIEPTVPNAAEPVLTEEQLRRAIRFNAFRFKDPYSLAVVRDIVGVPRFPAVSDEDLAHGVARYQASYGLTPNGQVGPATTARLVREARAESLPADAEQLRADNFITWAPAAGVHNGCGAGPDATGLATFFQWDVNFSTSLRNGWIVQEIVNARNRTNCAGGAIPETLTPRYWEAWWVDVAGNVRVPTAINAARTQATASAVPAPAHDLWRRASAAPSRGGWGMTARLFTCLRLPAGFAVGNVPDAIALPSTAVAPNADDLGLVAASRRAAGRWNCCGAPATQFHTP